jgi:hypothetical protein
MSRDGRACGRGGGRPSERACEVGSGGTSVGEKHQDGPFTHGFLNIHF